MQPENLSAEEKELWIAKMRSRTVIDGDCWVWMRSRTASGYGNLRFAGKVWRAHRLMWLIARGPIPAQFELDHFKCDNKACINPDHLRPVTRQENTLRSNSAAAKNAAKLVCPTCLNPYDHRNKAGARICKACRNKRTAAYKRKWRKQNA